jgi:hypothetical protein
MFDSRNKNMIHFAEFEGGSLKVSSNEYHLPKLLHAVYVCVCGLHISPKKKQTVTLQNKTIFISAVAALWLHYVF